MDKPSGEGATKKGLFQGCYAESSFFHGFSGRHLPWHNISGMGYEYYHWPLPDLGGGTTSRRDSAMYRAASSPKCYVVESVLMEQE